MVYRPAQVYNGSGWDDIGDKRIGAESGDIPQASVTDLTSDLASKLDLAGGKILQVVRATAGTDSTTNTTSFSDVTGMSVTITPTKSTSAVIVLALGRASVSKSSGTELRQVMQITDSSNNALSGAEETILGLADTSGLSGDPFFLTPFSMWAYSTPATTSATTYKLRIKTFSVNVTARVQSGSNTGQMYAIEVSA